MVGEDLNEQSENTSLNGWRRFERTVGEHFTKWLEKTWGNSWRRLTHGHTKTTKESSVDRPLAVEYMAKSD